MQQRVKAQILGRADRLPAFEQRGAADRIDRRLEQPFRDHPRPAAKSVADADIDILPLEIRDLGRWQEPQFDIGMQPVEAAEPQHEPARREGRLHRNGQRPALPPLGLLPGIGDLVEGGAQNRQQHASRIRQLHRPPRAMEKRQAEFFLKRPHLMADCGMGNVKFSRSAGETSMPCCSLEGPQRIQGRQAADTHKLVFLTAVVKSHHLIFLLQSHIFRPTQIKR